MEHWRSQPALRPSGAHGDQYVVATGLSSCAVASGSVDGSVRPPRCDDAFIARLTSRVLQVYIVLVRNAVFTAEAEASIARCLGEKPKTRPDGKRKNAMLPP